MEKKKSVFEAYAELVLACQYVQLKKEECDLVIANITEVMLAEKEKPLPHTFSKDFKMHMQFDKDIVDDKCYGIEFVGTIYDFAQALIMATMAVRPLNTRNMFEFLKSEYGYTYQMTPDGVVPQVIITQAIIEKYLPDYANEPPFLSPEAPNDFSDLTWPNAFHFFIPGDADTTCGLMSQTEAARERIYQLFKELKRDGEVLSKTDIETRIVELRHLIDNDVVLCIIQELYERTSD